MKLFAYPRERHVRRLSPGPYANYQSYKPFLREEFFTKCVYCQLHDHPAGASFTVDHYKAKSYFPQLSATYSNLFYACATCNTFKATWPYDRNHKLLPFIVPNPCDHLMGQHLEYDSEGRVHARSQDGERTLELLNLNSSSRLVVRRALIALQAEMRQLKQDLLKQKRHLKSKLRKKKLTTQEAESLRERLNQLEARLENTELMRSFLPETTARERPD